MALSRTWYNTLVDDDGSNTVGTIWDKAAVDHVYDDVDAELARLDTGVSTGVSTVTTTGTIATLPIPSGTGDLVVYMNNASAATIHGIAVGLQGQRLTLYAIGAGVVNLAYFSGSAGASTQRLVNWATSASTPISQYGSATYLYDTVGAWRLIAHEQGAWITPTFSAGNYTAAVGTVTVDAGDVTTQAYWLRGKTLTVAVNLTPISNSNASNTAVQIAAAAWGGFTIAKSIEVPMVVNDNATGNVLGLFRALAGFGTLFLIKASGNYAIATNTTSLLGEITFEVS